MLDLWNKLKINIYIHVVYTFENIDNIRGLKYDNEPKEKHLKKYQRFRGDV